MGTRKHKVANTTEFDSGSSRIIAEVEGTEIAIFRHDGEYYALANYCIHQAGPLCEGTLVGRTTVGEDGWTWKRENYRRIIVCPWHEWKFDITTGLNVDDDRYAIPRYDVEVTEDGDIYVQP